MVIYSGSKSKTSMQLYPSCMRKFWLSATIFGTLLPYYFFYNQIISSDFEWGNLLNLIFSTYATTGFVVDLLISSFIFWIYIINKVNKSLFVQIVVLNLVIGLSAALPYYLFKTYRIESDRS
ncbi:MAG: Terpene cyclase [Actinomycetota bacterium]